MGYSGSKRWRSRVAVLVGCTLVSARCPHATEKHGGNSEKFKKVMKPGLSNK